jgi:hypothetical protein
MTALWSTSAAMGPRPSLAMMGAVLRRDAEGVKRVAADIGWANEAYRKPGGVRDYFANYNIQFESARRNAAGYCRSWPCRPPYDYLPPQYEEDARQNAQRWVEISKRYPEHAAR